MLNWYKIATITTDIPSVPEQDTEANVLILHELELKSTWIAQTQFIPERRKNNILKRLKDLAYIYFEPCKDHFETTFTYWKDMHNIDDEDAWVNNAFDQLAEGYINEQEFFEDAMKVGIRWGGITVTPHELAKYPNLDNVREYIRETFRDDPESFSYQIEEWLNANYPDWDESGDRADNYLSERNLEDEFEEYITSDDYVSDYAKSDPSIFMDADSIRRCIREYVYPSYMATYGGSIHGVIEEIDEAIARLQAISEDSTVSEMASAVSLALNVEHVFGNIMRDYGGYGGGDDISPDFMNSLSAGTWVEEWKAEVKEEFKIEV